MLNNLNVGFPLACRQGSLAQGEWWNWYRARWSFGEVRNLKQVQPYPLLVLISCNLTILPRCRQISVASAEEEFKVAAALPSTKEEIREPKNIKVLILCIAE